MNGMDNQLTPKQALCKELRELLKVWKNVDNNPDASAENQDCLRLKIYEVCDKLDALEAEERGISK